MIHHDWARAREAIRTLLKDNVEQVMGREQFSDLLLTLAEAELELGNYEAVERVICDLPGDLPPHQRLNGGLLLARSYQGAGELTDALATLRGLEALVPREEWRREDRVLATSLAIALDDRYHAAIESAERALDGGDTQEALGHYRDVWDALEEELFPNRLGPTQATQLREKVQLRIGEVLLGAGRIEEAIEFLIPVREAVTNKGEASPLLLGSLRLLGHCQKRAGHHSRALGTYMIYLELSPPSSDRDEVSWEVGLCYLEIGERELALQALSEVSHSSSVELASLAQVYLSRLDLSEGHFTRMEERLFSLSSALSEDDPRQQEISFLRGEAALQQERFLEAVQFYGESLADQRSPWKTDALHGMGWAYLNLAASLDDPTAQVALFGQAEETFRALLDQSNGERAYLGLAHLYLSQAPLIGEQEARRRATEVLARPEQFTSPTAQAEALMLRAHLSTTYLEREALYSLLTDQRYSHTPQYAIGWYRRGINHYLQAEATGEDSLYPLAQEALTQAHSLLEAEGNSRAPLALKFQAQAAHKQGDTLRAYALLKTLEERAGDEVLYLLGSYGLQLGKHNAVGYLESLLNDYPDSPLAPDALKNLGDEAMRQGSYAQAERYFVDLATGYPHHPLAPEGLFWTAECMERTGQPPEEIAKYRGCICEDYPDSPLAAEAHFRLYPFSTYLEGNPAALDHLQEMSRLYPKSPYLVIAHYLRALNLQRHGQGQRAAESFALAADTFDRHRAGGTLPTLDIEYFASIRLRALVELGLTHLSKAKESEGTARHRALLAASEPLRLALRDLVAQPEFPRLLEEAEYAHLQVLLELEAHTEAEEAMARILTRYHTFGVEQGYYLSRTWYAQGRLAMASGRPELALSCFYHAEDSAAEGLLTDEQRLDLWLQQSAALTALGELEDGMLLLSRVINDKTPSPLRVEAMYQRAELYAQQGREELAIKQLEATARKSGPWALRAQEKLEELT